LTQEEILIVSAKVASEGIPNSTMFPELKLYISALMQPKVGNKKKGKSLTTRLSTLTEIVS